jgi:hypothetical protein
MEKTLLTYRPNEQEIFDHVCKHLAKQKKRCFDPKADQCRYRYGEMSCAVGSLISDEDYDRVMDDKNCSAEIVIDKWFPVAGSVGRLCRDLQVDHDIGINAEALKERLKLTAKNHKLKPDAIDLITEWEY